MQYINLFKYIHNLKQAVYSRIATVSIFRPVDHIAIPHECGLRQSDLRRPHGEEV